MAHTRVKNKVVSVFLHNSALIHRLAPTKVRIAKRCLANVLYHCEAITDNLS